VNVDSIRCSHPLLAKLSVKRVLLAAPALLAIGLLSGCGNSVTATTAALTIQVHLDQSRIAAGTAITGEAILTNNTSKDIPLDSCPSHWFQVGLANRKVQYNPGTPLDLCVIPHGNVTPGPHTVPITVETFYSGCGGTPPPEPRCTAFGIPPLPAGRYHTAVIMNGLPRGVRAPSPVWVTVTAPAPSVPASVPHGTITVEASACAGIVNSSLPIQVALWHGQNLLGVESGLGAARFVYRVAPGRYFVQSSAKNSATAVVSVGSTAHLDLLRVCK
jgi:hypothetical protein